VVDDRLHKGHRRRQRQCQGSIANCQLFQHDGIEYCRTRTLIAGLRLDDSRFPKRGATGRRADWAKSCMADWAIFWSADNSNVITRSPFADWAEIARQT
jgi:hypothetical protein